MLFAKSRELRLILQIFCSIMQSMGTKEQSLLNYKVAILTCNSEWNFQDFSLPETVSENKALITISTYLAKVFEEDSVLLVLLLYILEGSSNSSSSSNKKNKHKYRPILIAYEAMEITPQGDIEHNGVMLIPINLRKVCKELASESLFKILHIIFKECNPDVKDIRNLEFLIER